MAVGLNPEFEEGKPKRGKPAMLSACILGKRCRPADAVEVWKAVDESKPLPPDEAGEQSNPGGKRGGGR